MRRLLIISLISLCLGSCVPGHNDFSEYRQIQPHGWRYNEILSFTPTHDDSISEGTLTVALRHSNDYLYSNLYLEVAYDDASGNARKDTLNILLADKFGRWQGQGIGTDFQITDTVATKLRHITGHPVTVRHIMRVDTLVGIDLVGITFTSLP